MNGYEIDDLVLHPDGDDTVEEVARRVLSNGPFATVAFLVKTRPSDEHAWTGPHLWLHRYQKQTRGFKLVSRFHTTEKQQLDRLAEALQAWELVPQSAQSSSDKEA